MEQPLGILAGMGPRSTGYFLDLVIDQCQKLYGAKNDIDYPLMDIISLPTPFYIDQETDHDLMIAQLNKGIAMLENNECQLIAIPCNIAHVYFEAIEHQPETRILNIVNETLKALEPGVKQVALLATPATIKSAIYQDRLNDKNIDVFTNQDLQMKVNALISEFKQHQESATALKILSDIDRMLRDEQITTIIVACTDLAFIVKHLESYQIIDSTEQLAQRLIEEYLKLSQ